MGSASPAQLADIVVAVGRVKRRLASDAEMIKPGGTLARAARSRIAIVSVEVVPIEEHLARAEGVNTRQ